MKQFGFVAAGLILFTVFGAGALEVAPALKVDPQYGKVIRQCTLRKPSSRHVWIFKQWHLASSVNTKDLSDFKFKPQEKNQTAIYRQLELWVQGRRVAEIIAEGCSGELNADSQAAYNGWKISDLRKMVSEPSYAEVLTSVPLKLEAKFGDSLRTLCGDRDALVKENSLAFSDARGILGFLTRLAQYKKDASRVKNYLEGVVALYKMPSATTVEEAIERLKSELKGTVKRMKEAIDQRNLHLVDRIKDSQEKEVAVVYGGMHASGIAQLLEDAGIGCSVVEPIGYQYDEEMLLQKLDEALKTL